MKQTIKKSSSSRPTPVLKQFAGLWTLAQYPSVAKEWSLERKIREMKKAGFDAVGSRADPKISVLCAAERLDYICYTDANGKNFREKLEGALATRPARVNVQLCDHDTPPREAARVWAKTEAYARKLGLAADLEVHRDTATETPEKTYEIAEAFHRATGGLIDFSWDFSHLAVVKHLAPPYGPRLLVRPDLIRRSRQFHFRPFNGHHAQIPATDGSGRATAEFGFWLEFIDALLDCWWQGALGGETVYGCPEFGPVCSGYGLSTFPDVWKDAIFARQKIAAMWEAKRRRFKK
jgi:sugar phosphate isomerase/epimerase